MMDDLSLRELMAVGFDRMALATAGEMLAEDLHSATES